MSDPDNKKNARRQADYDELAGYEGTTFPPCWYDRLGQPEGCPLTPTGEFLKGIPMGAQAADWQAAQENDAPEGRAPKPSAAPSAEEHSPRKAQAAAGAGRAESQGESHMRIGLDDPTAPPFELMGGPFLDWGQRATQSGHVPTEYMIPVRQAAKSRLLGVLITVAVMAGLAAIIWLSCGRPF